MAQDTSIIQAALATPGVSVYAWGPPGVGKTHAAMEAGVRVGFNKDHVYSTTLSEDITVQEIVGHFVPKGDHFEWAPGPIAQALDHGMLILNEIARASTSVQDYLLGVLDSADVRRIDVVGGVRLEGHNDFRVVATANNPPDELDEALQDRFDAFVEITHPGKSLVQYLNSRMDGLGEVIYASFDDPERSISPRRALSWLRLVNGGIDEKTAAKLSFGPRALDILGTIKGNR